MTEPAYRVKPLVWEDAGKDAAFASTAVGFYDVDNWRYARNGEVIDSVDGGVAAAKASCEADYRSRVLRFLVEVVPEPQPAIDWPTCAYCGERKPPTLFRESIGGTCELCMRTGCVRTDETLADRLKRREANHEA